MARRRRGAVARRGSYVWHGVNVSEVSVTSAETFFVLVGAAHQEKEPGTLVRIRGHVALRGNVATSNTVLFKIQYVEINDAGAVTGDASANDNDEEDIAQRILWSYVYTQPSAADAGDQPAVTIELDIKAKLKLFVGGKHELLMMMTGINNARSIAAVNVRALVLKR